MRRHRDVAADLGPVRRASSGGVLGGSLTGLYHLMRGMDRRRFASAWSSTSRSRSRPTWHSSTSRCITSPAAACRNSTASSSKSYQRAQQLGPVRRLLHGGRETARLLVEELPAALALSRIIRRERADVIHLGNGVRANFDGILAGLLTGVPVVCHVKGFEKYGARERWAARHTILVCMTDAVLEACHQHGVRSPIEHVVYDAVDETWLQPQRDPPTSAASSASPPTRRASASPATSRNGRASACWSTRSACSPIGQTCTASSPAACTRRRDLRRGAARPHRRARPR